MVIRFFINKVLYLLIAFFVNSAIVYSQFVEFGEFRYRADRPPFKTYITDDYANLLNVVDSNSLPDRYRKVVVVVEKMSYNVLLAFINKNEHNQLDCINPERYQFVNIFDAEKNMTNSYKFSLDSYRSYLVDLFEYIEKNDCIISVNKTKLISKLKYW